MKLLLFLSLIVFPLPAYSEHFKEPCDTNYQAHTTSNFTLCSLYKLDDTVDSLRTILSDYEYALWSKSSFTVCKRVYENYKDGSMYPQLLADCMRRMNEYLIELDEHGVKEGKLSPIYNSQ